MTFKFYSGILKIITQESFAMFITSNRRGVGVMRHVNPPNIGNWYKNQDINNIFEVVATDDDGTVEIQYFAGEIEELDLEMWYELNLRQIPPPEDWSGPFEMSKEDLGYSDESFQPEDWSGPLIDIEPEDYY